MKNYGKMRGDIMVGTEILLVNASINNVPKTVKSDKTTLPCVHFGNKVCLVTPSSLDFNKDIVVNPSFKTEHISISGNVVGVFRVTKLKTL